MSKSAKKILFAVLTLLCLLVALKWFFGLHAGRDREVRAFIPSIQTIEDPEHKSMVTYAVRYERYGVMGLYHVSLAVTVLRDGNSVEKFHIDGAGRLSKYELPLGVCNLNFRFLPSYLSGSVNPRGYKWHFLGLLASEEFGPTYTLSEKQGARLLSLAHHGITEINSGDKFFYCTIPFQFTPVCIPAFKFGVGEIPAFQFGGAKFWTSNSVVASLVHIMSEEGASIAKPTHGCYPGFDGPYLPKSLFEYENNNSSDQNHDLRNSCSGKMVTP